MTTTPSRRWRVYCTQFTQCRWAGYRKAATRVEAASAPCPRCGKQVAAWLAAQDTSRPAMDGPQPNQSGPAFDERGIGRYHDTELMARTAIRLRDRGESDAALMAALLPGVLERIGELESPDYLPPNIVLGED